MHSDIIMYSYCLELHRDIIMYSYCLEFHREIIMYPDIIMFSYCLLLYNFIMRTMVDQKVESEAHYYVWPCSELHRDIITYCHC